MTTLVTGATGFVGSAVVKALLARGEPVRVLIRAGSNGGNLRDLPVETVVGDLAQPSTLRRVVVGCRALYHVAADYRLWAPQPGAMYRVNVDGTRALLRAAADAGVERIVYTSSVAAGRRSRRPPRRREHPLDARRHDRPLQALQIPG